MACYCRRHQSELEMKIKVLLLLMLLVDEVNSNEAKGVLQFHREANPYVAG